MHTYAGDLKNIKYVIHTAGPIWFDDQKTQKKFEDKLKSCVREALSLTKKLKDIESISLPCISSGYYRGPKDICSRVIVETCIQWLE